MAFWKFRYKSFRLRFSPDGEAANLVGVRRRRMGWGCPSKSARLVPGSAPSLLRRKPLLPAKLEKMAATLGWIPKAGMNRNCLPPSGSAR